MVPLLSLTVAIKDYYEIIHQLISVEGLSNIRNYTDLGPVFVYFLLSIKEFFTNIIGFQWIHNIWTYPIIIPDIASAMVSEISVLDGYFHTAFTLLDAPTNSINSFPIICFQKLMIGISNSLFLCLPTSVAHIITLRRFLIQGLEAGYISGLGVISGNFFFLAAVLFGWRFFLIPWLSLDILRYLFGFVLLVKYMWESSTEKRMVVEDISKQKIFLLSFFLSLTEQTSIFPFISNISMDSQSSIFESYSASTMTEFVLIHCFYLGGILIGSLSILNFCCWFWENPAFQIYMWTLTNFKVKTGAFYKYLNFGLLYLTMLAAITSIPYFGLDYTLTSPLGLVFEDRVVEESAFRAVFNEFSFLNMSPTDRNTRRNRGRHPRRSRWNRRTRKYRSFQSNLYEKESYDWMTIEDLNFGFDRQWSHRKMRNHRARYRLFPAKLTRSLKDQARKAFTKRHAFFETTENYFYHPSFHEYSKKTNGQKGNGELGSSFGGNLSGATLRGQGILPVITTTIGSQKTPFLQKTRIEDSSALRKFARKVTTKISFAQTVFESNSKGLLAKKTGLSSQCAVTCLTEPISSLRWKQVFSKIGRNKALYSSEGKSEDLASHRQNSPATSLLKRNQLRRFYQKMVLNKHDNFLKVQQRLPLSKKDLLMLRYRSFFGSAWQGTNSQLGAIRAPEARAASNPVVSRLSTNLEQNLWKVGSILYPIKYYLQKEEAFTRKLQYYGVKNFRRFSQDYNPPIFRVLMQRYFYHYKPTKRFQRTIKSATMRRYLRKSSRKARVLQNTNSGFVRLPIEGKAPQASSLAPPGQAYVASTFSPKGSLDSLPQRVDSARTLRAVSTQLAATNSDLSGQARSLLTPANHFYSMKGKRASRYRFQIYRDVLQHWYYSPVNRIFPKIEIDSFIRRQPQTHFLNASEERILHLRRFLLSEHYDTLRWYTLMEQYKQMQNKIGSTKSLSSRTYSQQFFGTFKKIRHLFAVTPSLQDQPILSFDQPLYNEYQNTTQTSLVNSSIVHEELLKDIYRNDNLTNTFMETDIITKSSFILKEYLKQVIPIRQKQIQFYLQEKNYWELMNFLRKGQKYDGESVSPLRDPTAVMTLLEGSRKDSLKSKKLEDYGLNTARRIANLQQSSLVSLLRKWKKSLGNQKLYKKALKNQFKRWRRTKKNSRKKMQKYQNRKLEFIVDSKISQELQRGDSSRRVPKGLPDTTIPSGLQKAYKDAIQINRTTLAAGQNISIGALHSKITRKLHSEMDIIGKVLKKQKGQSYLPRQIVSNHVPVLSKTTKITRKLTKIKALLQQQFRTTVGSVKKIGQRFITVKKTRSWWNQKSTDTWRPSRRRLDLDSLRITVKHASIRSNRPSKLLKPYSKTLQNRYTLKKEQFHGFANSDTMQNDNKIIEKRWRSIARASFISISADNANNQRTLLLDGKMAKVPEGSQFFETYSQREPARLKLKENNSGGGHGESKDPSGAKGRNWIDNVDKNRLSHSFFQRQFKRKRVSRRRGRKLVAAGYSRRPNLSALIKRSLFGESLRDPTERVKSYTIDKNTVLSPLLTQKSPYYRKRKHREWDRKVKPDNGIKTNKYRKRRISFYGKLRSEQKELIRVRWKLQVQKWWWQFMPSLRNTVESQWVTSAPLSSEGQAYDQVNTDILQGKTCKIRNTDKKVTTLLADNERSSMPPLPSGGKNSLQIGDRDFKPFGLPEALRVRRELEDASCQPLGRRGTESVPAHRGGPKGPPIRGKESLEDLPFFSNLTRNALTKRAAEDRRPEHYGATSLPGARVSSYSSEGSRRDSPKNSFGIFSPYLASSAKLQITNAVPFYAGWDESLRKFVITNVLFSLRDATYEMKNIQTLISDAGRATLRGNVVFTEAPLRGQNGATTIYWQTPFSTYETDQFFTLGVDGFSPLQWSRFNFTQSIVKNWSAERALHTTLPQKAFRLPVDSAKALSPILVKDLNIYSGARVTQGHTGSATYKLSFLKNPSFGKVQTSAMLSREARRRQKRYKRVRRHPRAPIWYPSGSLISDVLPTQYIYAFDSTARRPRDRYMQRRWRKRSQLLSNSSIKQIHRGTTDFTLRRRPNGRRKYHRRGGKMRSLLTVAYPKRQKFIGSPTDELRWRPERSEKDLNYTIKLEEVRKRRGMALRRRKLRQVFPVIRRFKTLNGGFVWPGTYLLLEQRNVPKMHVTTNDIKKVSLERKSLRRSRRKKQRRKIKRKTRAIAQWNIQPKKYLLQKHNQKVIKKKLQKAYRTHNLAQKLEQLKSAVHISSS